MEQQDHQARLPPDSGIGLPEYFVEGAACAQIERAISLYETGDYLCALTLAGAAEEMLGSKLRSRGGKPVLSQEASATATIRVQLEPDAGSHAELKRQHIYDANEARNWLKHSTTGKDRIYTDPLLFDARASAHEMLDRALRNYWVAESSMTPVMQRWRAQAGEQDS